MRFSVSKRILPGVRLGITFGGGRKPRVWASERLGRGVRISESTTLGKRRRKR